MLKNAYILYIEETKSKKYLEDCAASCAQYPNINLIPVEGYKGANYKDICNEFGIGIIPFYVNQMDTNRDTLNRAFSCTAGHIKIWKKIVESGEAGVVFEHDAVVKQDFTTLEPIDGEILWLGPRIHNLDDYNYPDGWESKYVEVDRWEGTHAYAITAKTAQMLLDRMDEYGLNDSIDGQLGMRNIFDMRMRAVDPPFVVAVVSDRQSTIELSGNPATWNAYSTDGFRAGLKAGREPPVRQLYFTDNRFMKHTGVLDTIFKDNYFYKNEPLKVLVVGGEEGMSTLWLSNKLLRHDDSQLFCAGGFERKNWQIFNFNTYFSKYYYKLNAINTNDVTDLLVASSADPDIMFDVVYINGNKNTTKDTVFNGTACISMLRHGGLIIFDNYDHSIVKAGVDIIDKAYCMESLHKGDIAVFQY